MNKIRFILLLLGLPFLVASQNVINSVIEYKPAPGQHINIEYIGTPLAAEQMPVEINNMVSLGSFGGYIILGFEKPCVNDIDNPYGIDFTVFGNAFPGSYEPGVIWVMKDENHNGVSDDTWYEIAGSNYFHSKTILNYSITYFKTNSRDINWKDNFGDSGIIKANSFNLQNYYPESVLFAEYPQDSVTFSGTLLEAGIDNLNPLEIQLKAFAFGYADNHPKKQGIELTVPDNPYTSEIEGAGGDPIDISWAVDSFGDYVNLDTIHFVKIVTGNFEDLGVLGESSTDISYIVDVEANSFVSGKEDLFVIYHYPEKVLLGDSVQFEANYFIKGRKVNEPANYSLLNQQVASISTNGKFISHNIGVAEIHVSVLDKNESATIHVVIPDSIQLKIDFSSVYPGDTVYLGANVFDNEGDLLNISTHFSVLNSEIGNIINNRDSLFFVANKPGETEINCTVEDFSIEKTIPVKVLSESDNIKVLFTLKTENENLFPLQWIEVGMANLNGYVENRQTDYSNNDRLNLGHALLSGLQKAELNFKFRDDEKSNEKLYLYSVENDGQFTYGWGGETEPQAFAKSWIVRLNSNQFINEFDKVEISDGDTVVLYHISDISAPWNFTRMISDKDSAKIDDTIEITLEQTTCTLLNDSIFDSEPIPIVNQEVVAEKSYFSNDSGKASVIIESQPPLEITSGNDAVLISKRIITGANKNYNSEINIYPNPVENELFISGNNLESKQLYIYNISGVKIFTKEILSNSERIELQDFMPGIYFLKINAKSTVETFKIIKK